MTIAVNGAFWPQPVTGQQRYAREIVRHLPSDVPVVTPPARHSGSSMRTWAWTQTQLPAATRKKVLLSFTSRAPVAHRRHVFTVHDLFTLTNPEWFSPKYVRVKAPLLRWQLRHAAGLLTVSEPVREQIRELGLTAQDTPIVVAPNAAGEVFRNGPAGAADTELPFIDGLNTTGFLLAVGSLEPRKNLQRLVAAHRLLPTETRREFPLVLIGGSWRAFASLDIDAHDPAIVVPGFVPDDVLVSAYYRATAVVAPSLAEGFGIPLVEAHACGARLLVSDIPVFRWVVGEAASYFDPLDERDIARALAEAIAEPARPSPLPRSYDYAESARVALELARHFE